MQGKYKIDFELFNSINPRTMTKFVKKDQVTSSWYEIDAKNAVVGRLATVVSNIIRGKNKTTYTPHMDDGDFVVVKNIEQAKFTGKKFHDKKYYKHTGHPGGIKTTSPSILFKKKPEDILKFIACKFYLINIFDNNKITMVHMRSICCFVLPSYNF